MPRQGFFVPYLSPSRVKYYVAKFSKLSAIKTQRELCNGDVNHASVLKWIIGENQSKCESNLGYYKKKNSIKLSSPWSFGKICECWLSNRAFTRNQRSCRIWQTYRCLQGEIRFFLDTDAIKLSNFRFLKHFLGLTAEYPATPKHI